MKHFKRYLSYTSKQLLDEIEVTKWRIEYNRKHIARLLKIKYGRIQVDFGLIDIKEALHIRRYALMLAQEQLRLLEQVYK